MNGSAFIDFLFSELEVMFVLKTGFRSITNKLKNKRDLSLKIS